MFQIIAQFLSLTSVICKLMESLIRDQIMEHFLLHKLFSDKQYGFISYRSTVLQLLKILDDWTNALEQGGQIDIIYTDFEKAFDRVSHIRLFSKLAAYGLNAELIKWLESFLCGRKQRVVIKGTSSQWNPVVSGIPQGSVLGPLLFVVYVNDLPSSCNLCPLFMFADDSKLYKHIQTNSDHVVLQNNCQNVYAWCKEWLMTLNTGKCKVLTVCRNANNSDKFEYGFQCDTNNGDTQIVKIEHVDSMIDLGVTIDSGLSFDQHIHEKVNKAYKILGIIRRNFVDIGKDVFLLLYKSLVRSQLEFSSVVYNPHLKSLDFEIEKVQKRATKLIRECKDLSYKERLRKLKLPTLKYRRVRGDMIQVFKILHGIYDDSVVPNLTLNSDSRTRGNAYKLKHQYAKYDLRKFSFTFRVVSVWNNLPDTVVCSQSVNSFKNGLDRFWANQEFLYVWEASIPGTNAMANEVQ
jgi:ribonucleases P/MRP protein subunit RPP40